MKKRQKNKPVLRLSGSFSLCNCQRPELLRAGMNVGRNIMGTISNTLILAYLGVSLPLLLLYFANNIPVTEFVNWETISAEIVRALSGSIGLILTIPLTAITFIALSRQTKE